MNLSMTMLDWAEKWDIPAAAIKELADMALYFGPPDQPEQLESSVQRDVRLEAARLGKYLFRNNRGAGKMASGNYLRYGLANDTKALGEKIKSADLIGLESVLITPAHLGTCIGRFLSVEVKHSEWHFSGTLEEYAQLAWATLINANGGRAIITNSTGAL